MPPRCFWSSGACGERVPALEPRLEPGESSPPPAPTSYRLYQPDGIVYTNIPPRGQR